MTELLPRDILRPISDLIFHRLSEPYGCPPDTYHLIPFLSFLYLQARIGDGFKFKKRTFGLFFLFLFFCFLAVFVVILQSWFSVIYLPQVSSSTSKNEDHVRRSCDRNERLCRKTTIYPNDSFSNRR